MKFKNNIKAIYDLTHKTKLFTTTNQIFISGSHKPSY